MGMGLKTYKKVTIHLKEQVYITASQSKGKRIKISNSISVTYLIAYSFRYFLIVQLLVEYFHLKQVFTARRGKESVN